jgi:DNA-binding transcriptional MerR regulator
VEQMSIGEFARATRLSPKALRLYDELGLLLPARVDASSGYRDDEETQLPTARLVVALRQLDVPLPRIQYLLALEPAAAANHLEAYWAAVEDDHSGKRNLAAHLVDRLNGKRSVVPDIVVHAMPERHILCLQGNAENEEEVWRLGKDFIALIRERPLPPMEGPTGASFLIYHGEVNADSDGPVEWCRPIPGDQRDDLAGRYLELVLRVEPPHDETWVHMGPGGQPLPPSFWEENADGGQRWAADNQRRPSALGVRIVYEVLAGRTPGDGPDTSFAVPLA